MSWEVGGAKFLQHVGLIFKQAVCSCHGCLRLAHHDGDGPLTMAPDSSTQVRDASLVAPLLHAKS